MAHLDPELEHFKRSIDLVAYARKAGYEPWPEPVGRGLTVLDHPDRDRIVVAKTPSGVWIYASVSEYQPRAPHESEAHALARLRGCVIGARDKGTVVEFVQGRDAMARSAEVSLDRVRERLRAFRDDGLAFDLEARRWSPRDQDRAPEPGREAAAAQREAVPGEARTREPQAELNRRRYDWSPPVPNAPRETEVDQRLRRWREAQLAVDGKIRAALEVSEPARSPAVEAAPSSAAAAKGPSPADRLAVDRRENLGQEKAAELNRRRYDWTPAPSGREAIPRGNRGRSTDRDR